MAPQSSDASSLQSTSGLVPPENPRSGESSRLQLERSGANRDRVGIQLKIREFYDEREKTPPYCAEDLPYESNHEQIGEGAYAKVYKTTIKGGFYNAGQGPISTVSKFFELCCVCLTRFAGSENRTKGIFGSESKGELPDREQDLPSLSRAKIRYPQGDCDPVVQLRYRGR